MEEFYRKQNRIKQNEYKELLKFIGELSNLFSNSEVPFLQYRIHENIFCEVFNVQNVAREDSAVDAVSKNKLGIGLKTWQGCNTQKIAEFDKAKPLYENLDDLKLVKKISKLRNERIDFAYSNYGLKDTIYHIVKRDKGLMMILESSYDKIHIPSVKLISKQKNTIKFKDKYHEYKFNTSKSTLLMKFENMEQLDAIDIKIIENAISEVKKYIKKYNTKKEKKNKKLYLRLYSIDKKTNKKIVNKKSGLNQWNASGRKRNLNEVYIPYPSEDRKRDPHFFPNKDEKFALILPDGKELSAKVCQQGGKAIMTNPNKDLGNWLFGQVLKQKKRKVLTYKRLLSLDVDCVVFTKIGRKKYSIDFCKVGTYESVYKNEIRNLNE